MYKPKFALSPDGAKHGRECEERGHGHGDPAGDGLRGEEEGEPGDDDEQPRGQVGLEQVVADLAPQQHSHYHSGVHA